VLGTSASGQFGAVTLTPAAATPAGTYQIEAAGHTSGRIASASYRVT
jgi:hypothetical protein